MLLHARLCNQLHKGQYFGEKKPQTKQKKPTTKNPIWFCIAEIQTCPHNMMTSSNTLIQLYCSCMLCAAVLM